MAVHAMRLTGKTVWLIGASSGIGEAMVRPLVETGARVALSARREERLRAVARDAGDGERVLVKPLDVTDKAAVARVAQEIAEAWEAIDVLIYSAGDWEQTDILAFDIDAFEKQVEVNYLGMVRAIGAVLPQMVERGAGAIVGVASLSGYRGLPLAEGYGSTKAAVNYLLQTLRIDLRRHGVAVTTVNPGFVRSALTEKNRFVMPFLMEPRAAARIIVEGLLQDKTEIHFPLRLSVPLKLLGAVPRPAYEWIIARAFRR